MLPRPATLTFAVAALGVPLFLASAGDAAKPKKPRLMTITASDYSFEAPEIVPAGATSIRLINEGSELHHVWLARLEQGKTVDDVKDFLQNQPGAEPPEWIVNVGGPNSAMAGGEAVTSVVLMPGDYVMVCFILSKGGASHLSKGMVRPLRVAPAPDGALTLPSADVTARLTDYSFAFSKPLRAGHHVIRIENTGKKLHELVLAKLAPGRSMADLMKWMQTEDGPPPATMIGGATGIMPGGANTMDVTLQAGEYGVVCFVTNPGEKQPHFMLGMIQQFTVKS